MEDNTSKRTSGNDILKEAANEAKRVSNPQAKKQPDDEILVFHRERVTKPTTAAGSSSTAKRPLEHTAEIRGGAVVRPLKRTPDAGVPRKPAGAPANRGGTANSAARPTGGAGQSDLRMQRTTAAIPVVKPQPQTRVNGIKAPGQPSGASRQTASEARRPAPQTRGNTSAPGARSAAAANRAPAPGVKPQTRLRTENDDYEIDEATYQRQPRGGAYEGGFADSANSAVMSLVKAVVYIVAIIAVSIVLSIFTINTANDVFKFVTEEKMVTVAEFSLCLKRLG